MKTHLCMVLALATLTGYAQKLVPLDAQPPQLPGGFDAYVEKNIKLPRDVRKKKVEGEVDIRFTVDSVGSIAPESIKVIKGLCRKCDKEAIRLVRESPTWEPAVKYGSGKKVAMGYRTTVKFYSAGSKK